MSAALAGGRRPERGRLAVDVRAGTAADLPAVQAIYAHHVQHGLGSFEEVPPSIEEMTARWQAAQAGELPYLVAEAEPEGVVLGMAYARRYHQRSAYRYTVEDAVYVAPPAQGRGVGRQLLGSLVTLCAQRGLHRMIASIGDSGNTASIRLHERLGFRRVGVLPEVGFKFGRWVDVVIMARSLTD